jgi:SagB-type dehydrogenase family enzyme
MLELVRGASLREACRAFSLGQELAADAGFLVVHTAPLAEAVASLGERAYRPLCMDAGHHGERLNIAAEALGLGSSGIGGYFDDLVNETLGLDLAEAVLYVTTVGTPA